MSEIERKEIVRYSVNLDLNETRLDAFNKAGGKLSLDELKRVIGDRHRIEIANLFYLMGRYYADFKYNEDTKSFNYNDDLPLPPMEIIISIETELWDAELSMRVIETGE